MKLSVCCITYNHEKFIAQAIESFLMQQTDFDFEIVIGEDCSTDNTRSILGAYEKKYPQKFNILYNKKNMGVMPNFIQALKACQKLEDFQRGRQIIQQYSTKLGDLFRSRTHPFPRTCKRDYDRRKRYRCAQRAARTCARAATSRETPPADANTPCSNHPPRSCPPCAARLSANCFACPPRRIQSPGSRHEC